MSHHHHSMIGDSGSGIIGSGAGYEEYDRSTYNQTWRQHNPCEYGELSSRLNSFYSNASPRPLQTNPPNHQQYNNSGNQPMMQLPNLRDLLQDNYQTSSPNNSVYLSNNSCNTKHSISTPSNPSASSHMLYDTEHAPPTSSFSRNSYQGLDQSNVSSSGVFYSNNNSRKSSIQYSSSPSSPLAATSNTASPQSSCIYPSSFGFSPVYPRERKQHETHVENPHELIKQLRNRIVSLERELENQTHAINDLQHENQILKSTCINSSSQSDYQHVNDPPLSNRTSKIKKQSKKRKNSPNSNENQSNNNNNLLTTKTTFSLVDESCGSRQKSMEDDLVLGTVEEFSVKWKGDSYVLVDVFKNRTQIMNYFVPLYQSQFPDRNCKVVLSSEEYKQLFRENSHRSQSERKHAWRISIFTIDFYNFVKNQQV